MTNQLKTKPGINGANTLSIPKEWDSVWFRKFIANSLKGADVRNAVGVNGVTVSGTIASPYATISGGGPQTMTAPIVINSTPGQTSLTVNGAANANTVVFIGSTTAGQSYGPYIAAGTNSTDRAILIQNEAGTATFFEIFGDGHGTLGPGSTSGLSWTASGNVIIAGTGTFTVAPATITFSGVPTSTTAGVGGSAGALPANPVGYFSITIGSTVCRIPYYT